MSEVQSRPSAPRGRGSSRGARGGHGARGGARGGARHKHTGEKADQQSFSTVEDEGEIGELKKKYASPLSTLRELFPDWTDDDLVFALQETDGDLESTIERITEGSVSQWGKVEKKSKEKARSKSHDPSAAGHDSTTTGQAGRGGRTGRGGHDGAGRTGERGRGSGRGGRGGSTAARVPRSSTSRGPSSDAAKQSATSDEAWSWVDIPPQATAQTAAQPTDGGWDSAAANKTPLGSAAATTGTSGDAGGAPEANKGGVIPTGAKKSWASIFAKPVPVPVVKPTPPPALPPQDHAPPTEVSQPETEALPPPPTPPLTTDAIETPADEAQAPTPALAEPNEPEVILEPSKDKLTESNVEQVLDTSAPPISNTQASTIATSQVAPSGAGTPYSAIGQLPTPRPPLGGFASSAYRAAGTPGRSASFQRRILDQQEAVVMPSNHAVDRAAVQFGSMGLNGVSDEQDVDEDREEAETRAQPPQHSPVAHPVASLPPAPHQSLPSHQASSARDAEPTPRQTPGLPIAPQQQPPTLPQAGTQPTAAEVPTASQPLAPDNQPSGHPYAQLNRFAQSAPQQDQHSTAPKVYDPFGQHATQNQSQQSHYDGYPTHAHAHAQAQQSQMQQQQQQQQQQPSLIGGSTALNNYSSYYTSDQQSRAGYPNYYSAMYGGQQSGQMAQEASAGQQRPGSGIGQSITDSSHYPASQAPQAASRYGQVGEAQASGGSTPNPSVVGQHAQQHQQQQQQHQQAQASQAQPSQSMQGQQAQAQAQATGHSNFPFGQPYYSNPYYAYMNSYNNYNQGYGAPFGGKAGHYAQPSQGYGIAPQSTYEHSSSPVNVGGYGQASLHGRDTGLGGAVSDYARTGSSQAGPNQAQTGGSAAFGGGIPDVFGRSGFPGHNQPLGQHHGNAQSGADDALKAFGDSKVATGPSPALNHSVAGRADTAGHNSNAPGVHQPATTLAASQSQQAQHSYGGYHAPLNPHHHLHHGGQTTQYGNLGGLGGHPAAGAQSHQAAAGYGGYPANYAGNYYAGGGRGGGGAGGGAGAGAGGAGWSGNYGH